MATNLLSGRNNMAFKDITLQGSQVRLEPLNKTHLPGLSSAIKDGQLHKLMVTNVPHPDDLQHFLNQAQTEHSNNQSLVFCSIDQLTKKIIGSSRFMHTDWSHRRTEIGFTFIAKSKQRTAVNTEAKLLMLEHAFETLNMNRVAFRTDHLNQRSQNAILRLGAKKEGTLRNHMVMADGRIRDTVVFSILNSEWPGIKSYLIEKLNQ